MKKLWLLCVLLAAAGCKNGPIERTRDASDGGALGAFGSGNFIIFGDELQSGGGAFFYPGGENQSLAFNDQSDPIGRRSIRYSWNGGTVDGQHIFAGFSLMHTAVQDDYESTPGKDLRSAGYTKATFTARGSLSTNTLVKVEVAAPSTPTPCVVLSTNGTDTDINAPTCSTAQLRTTWQSYSINIPNSAQAGIKDLFKATLIFTPLFPGSNAPGQGGTVYFDQIQYQP